MSLHEALADELNATRLPWEFAYVEADDIADAAFRRGGAEIEVTFESDARSDYPSIITKTIPAEGILTALLRKALETERE